MPGDRDEGKRVREQIRFCTDLHGTARLAREPPRGHLEPVDAFACPERQAERIPGVALSDHDVHDRPPPVPLRDSDGHLYRAGT